jgi:ubiquinone/menaquinone biosynthesis C-methylase UbiE
MEVSAADPQHRAMVHAYLTELDPAPGTRVVEIGCGTGAISRMIAAWPGVAEVVGMDPSPILIDRARDLGRDVANASFHEADGARLPLPESSFDVAVLHRVLSHAPQPETLLAEAFRVLRSGGRLVAFDGDYSTVTLATGDHDPLQVCVDAMVTNYTTDPWIVRRLAVIVARAGFVEGRVHSHGFVQIGNADYMVSIADRGADALVASGRIGRELAVALKAEARRRVESGSFFGHIAYASLIAGKPA